MSYTPILKAANKVQAHNVRRLRIDAAHTAHREEGALPFVCPVCDDGSAVPTSCLRCEVPMRELAKSVRLPRASDATDQTTRSLGAAALGLGVLLCTPAIGVYAVAAMNGHRIDWALGLGALALLAALTPLILANRWPGWRQRWRERRHRRAAEARAAEVPAVSPADAPERALVRVRGHLRVADGAVHVEDDRGCVRVPVGPLVRVVADDGERFVLSDGEEVEVVGFSVRALGAGEAYRDTRGPLAFDETRPVDVLVRRARP
ncbi:MAG: hypothetical protein KF729_23330 [Sandaracinaceae bacterium]|nr:hypothetical protein [Sandaracinaceae bacterium]